jgi:hypothetical protein
MNNPSGGNGRGNGRGFGRGNGRGRGRGRSLSRNKSYRSSRNNNSTTTMEIKFGPQTQGRAQQVTYATVLEAITQHIQKSYKNGSDVAASLKQGSKLDLSSNKPKLQITKKKDADGTNEQRGFEIEYQELLSRYLNRVDCLDENLKKAYALIMTNYCTKSMQSRIEEHPDFTSKIEDDPIALLEAIKVLMHDPVRAQYGFIYIMTDALGRFYHTRQAQEEVLSDYYKRFKQEHDVLKSTLGTEFLNHFVESTADYKSASDAIERKALKDGAFEQWCAYQFLRNSDYNKYGSVMKSLVSQYSLGNDQYPRTLASAVDVLSNHRFDARYSENLKKQ